MVVVSAVRVVVIVVRLMLAIELLRERIVFAKALVVTVLVAAAIRARFRRKRLRFARDRRADTPEHVFQHGVGFELQMIRVNFDRRVPVAEMVSGAHQRERIHRAHDEHVLRRRDHAHEAAVIGDEHVAIGEHRAARHDQRDVLAVIERGGEAALAARIEGEVSVGARLTSTGASRAVRRLSRVRIRLQNRK